MFDHTMRKNTKMYTMIKTSNKYIYDILLEVYNRSSDIKLNIDVLSNEINKICPNELSLNELYYLISDYCASRMAHDLDYKKIASITAVMRLHNITSDNIEEVAELLYGNINGDGTHSPLITNELYSFIKNNAEKINKNINYERDFSYDFFGLRTLERSYLSRIHKNERDIIIERPQHLIMRVALGIHGNDIESALESYELMSKKYFTHATPTLFNAGTQRPQMSSCYLLNTEDDLEHIFKTISDSGMISKWAGGIGISISSLRAKDSIIRGTNGRSSGLIPLCVLFEKVAKYANQGGRRKGSIALYLEPWHSEIMEFCELRKNTGDENLRARDLFMALWVPDLLVKRVLEGGKWSLMCPDKCPGLTDSYGEEFETLYLKYESEGKYNKQIQAIDLWYHIMECQIETGMPYLLYKDHANRKSNQQNLGTIKCSNLCSEIIQYTSKDEVAVCNLSSICLTSFLTENNGKYNFDYSKLMDITKVIVRNLNKVIDINYYPIKETRNSNMKHRPIGIGVQGFADLLNIMELSFGSDESKELNKRIFETIYYAALHESCELAKKYGHYESFNDSPFSQGKLQWHLWNVDESQLLMDYKWDSLIENIKKYGTRNSLLTTIMPTQSTAQIMGSSEGIEPYMSNIFSRSTLAGEFPVINENLIKCLIKRGLWSDQMRKRILAHCGSIQKIKNIPQDIKDVYKTAFEIQQKHIIELSAGRGPFIDQSQSLNLFMDKPDFDKLSNCHLKSWELGLKTAVYYLRSKPAVNPIQFGIEADELKQLLNDDIVFSDEMEELFSSLNRKTEINDCEVCSS